MIYLDNAATSFPKPRAVLRELYRSAKKYSGNPGRSSHYLSYKAAEIIYEARERVASFFNSPSPENVVFTYNATYALNIAIKSFLKSGHAVVSDVEHNAVIRPLEALRANGASYSLFSTDGDIVSNIEKEIKSDTVCIISTLSSNVTGKCVDISKLSECAKKHRLYLIVDASQAAGHLKIDLEKTPCDVLCAPGHKALFGVLGSGFAIFKDNERGRTIIEGGSGAHSIDLDMPTYLPEGYEAGSLGMPAIAALTKGIDFVEGVGIEAISSKLEYLTNEFSDRIKSLCAATLYPSENGIVSFNFAGTPASEIGSALDKRGIAVRAGLHCAPLAHKKLGTLAHGSVRVSLSCFNTRNDADRFYTALKEIRSSLI